ncbi:LOW QUALITY PROTEIN: pentatricopeptide repeat-containing protein At5g48910-like [Diospyros lotus]|uniref:LOW QUALITY PROTEIN: pentatricopeptide repeat-containing protein At5g48910-like n=1 Tax=Diospyros lotus TaxID=55363 RepID=UPI002258C1A8|nr:LOW QUALITY PROTEIN: pentatricopeptide repeat-containing protein At5g48910-like [Diospyros lotus]
MPLCKVFVLMPHPPPPPPPPPPSCLFISHQRIRGSTTSNFTQKTILNLLNTKCATSLQHLKQVHALVLKTGHFHDHYIAGTLVKNYANPHFGSLDTSVQVFDHVWKPNVFVWNSMIKGFLDNNQPCKVVSFYYRMVVEEAKPNKFTYPPLFKACTTLQAVEEGVQIHAQSVKHGVRGDRHIKSAGIQMYGSFGRLVEAKNMLDDGDESDVVCWNAMIDGYMRCGNVEASRLLFGKMTQKNVGTWNAMISGFARCGMIKEAREMFDKMPERDEISWSAIIDGYNKGGHFKEALEVFQEMLRERIRPRKYVLSSVLAACANLGALDQGRWIHSYIERNSIPLDAVLGTSFVDMYAQCGRIDLAWEVFETMKHKEVFSWNAMIGGLAIHGRAEDAIELFFKMQREKMRSDGITFVGILNACAHAGLIDEGLNLLDCMEEVFGVEPTIEHYGCVVDLLGRAGLLAEAEELINCMPVEANAAVWGALLGACRKHGNVELAERVGRILLELEPRNSGRYALLSNIYAKAGRWEDAEKVRKLMKERGVKTSTGRSMIDLNGTVHEFKMGEGSSHPEMKEIYLMLERVIERMQLEGYKPNTCQVLFDIDEEEKETALGYHSEKIAIALGLLKTAPGTTIRITKNLRVCDDCHSATKLISKIYNRKIIVRDRVRYHHFQNGTCSCRDFW